MKYNRMKHNLQYNLQYNRGVTLVELLIGIALVSLLTTLVAVSFRTSNKTLEVSNRQVPMEVSLQSGIDGAGRVIRQSTDVSLQGNGLILSQSDGSTHTITFSNNTLWLDSQPLQSHLASANFSIQQEGVVKSVLLDLSDAQQDSQNQTYTKRLVSLVSLRNVPPDSNNPPPPPVVAPPPPPSALAPPVPTPPPALVVTPPPPPPSSTYHRQAWIPLGCNPRYACR